MDVSTAKVKRLQEQDEGASSSEARKNLKKELTTVSAVHMYVWWSGLLVPTLASIMLHGKGGGAYQKQQVLWVTQVCCLFLPVSLQLRLMQSEQTVEAVVRERSLKVFKERCWQAYQPPDL